MENALIERWVAPSDSVYAVKPEIINDQVVLKDSRRADKFSKMAILAAYDALEDSGIKVDKKSLGIIMATGFGPHATTYRFLDDILDYGDRNVSPTSFSHSVHNAAVSYIASVLNVNGPTITLAQFAFSFQQALILAKSWLKEGRCEYVLVGAVDELSKTMEYIFNRKLRVAEDGKIKPFRFLQNSEAVAGEGAVFFLVTNVDTGKRYCRFEKVYFNKDVCRDLPDIYILDNDGIIEDETAYRKICAEKKPLITSYTPIFGSMMTVSAFNCAAASLILKNQICYANPVLINPYKVNICANTKKMKIDSINCVRYNCSKVNAVVELKR
ncbi:MAG: beta-ketoacyl synthase N-terminal-like domain-containing protein [Candidatus Ratteibacteria bacterium]